MRGNGARATAPARILGSTIIARGWRVLSPGGGETLVEDPEALFPRDQAAGSGMARRSGTDREIGDTAG